MAGHALRASSAFPSQFHDNCFPQRSHRGLQTVYNAAGGRARTSRFSHTMSVSTAPISRHCSVSDTPNAILPAAPRRPHQTHTFGSRRPLTPPGCGTQTMALPASLRTTHARRNGRRWRAARRGRSHPCPG